jgi:multidrug resistance efflux pump
MSTDMSMKEQYEQKLEAQLDEWGAEINKLKAKAKGAEADGKIEYEKEIKEINAMQEAAKDKLKELKNAGEDAWRDLKVGIDDALGSLDKAFKSATSRLK